MVKMEKKKKWYDIINFKGGMIMFCPNCGKSIPKDVNFCPYCGENIEEYLRLKEKLKKEKEIGTFKEEKQAMNLEDLFRPEKKEDKDHSSIEDRYREEIQEQKEKSENIEETIFRIDPQKTEAHEFFGREIRKKEEIQEEEPVQEIPKEEITLEEEIEEKPFKETLFTSKKEGNSTNKYSKMVNNIKDIGQKLYTNLLKFHEFMNKKTVKPIEKMAKKDKVFYIIAIVYALALIFPLISFQSSLLNTGNSFGTYIVILLLTAFDGISTFLALTVAQLFMQSKFEDRPLKEEVFKHAIVLSTMIAIFRVLIYLIGKYLVGIDAILLAKPLGNHPVLFILLFIFAILALMSIHWNNYEKKDYWVVLGLATGGAILTGIVMYLVGSTIFRMLIMAIAPHFII